MKQVNHILLITGTAILLSGTCERVHAQASKADERYMQYEFSKAIPKYEQILRNDSMNKDALENLGNCYRLTNQIDKAEKCYAKVVHLPGTENIYKLYYAQMLLTAEKINEAQQWFEAYRQAEPKDKRGEEFLDAINDWKKSQDQVSDYTVEPININSADGDFGAACYKDGIVFSSSRQEGGWADRKDSWTGNRYTSIYYSKRSGNGFSEPELFVPSIQTKYNNGPVCFNRNMDEMYFTRNNIEEGKVHTNAEKVVKLKIFSSKFTDGHWIEPVPFAYNSDSYSCAHPALSQDGSKLYFSSDMPGSLGGMDIWVCTREGSGWSKPKNLGSDINTAGNEIFPTVGDDGTIYFSSNGLAGHGGLDIFSITAAENGYTKPHNMGAPFNSPDDDFYYVKDAKTNTGYFSSNRVHQGMNDNIFVFHKNKILLTTLVIDKVSGQPLALSNVKIVQDGKVIDEKQTDEKGQMVAEINPSRKYQLIAGHEEYVADSLNLADADFHVKKDSATAKVPLTKADVVISMKGKVINGATGQPSANTTVMLIDMDKHDTLRKITDEQGDYSFTDLIQDKRYRVLTTTEYCETKFIDTSTAAIRKSVVLQINLRMFCMSDNFVLNNIYYELDKYTIRKDAAKELDKLVALLKKYPLIKIELGSHTDCRGSYAYNMQLSQKRANSVGNYIIEHGIDKSRLTSIGYGESRLINKCACEGNKGIDCTEEQHQLNRRTEVKILSGK